MKKLSPFPVTSAIARGLSNSHGGGEGCDHRFSKEISNTSMQIQTEAYIPQYHTLHTHTREKGGKATSRKGYYYYSSLYSYYYLYSRGKASREERRGGRARARIETEEGSEAFRVQREERPRGAAKCLEFRIYGLARERPRRAAKAGSAALTIWPKDTAPAESAARHSNCNSVVRLGRLQPLARARADERAGK